MVFRQNFLNLNTGWMNPVGVTLHNTADNGSAVTHENRLHGYTQAQLANGFAHFFIDGTDEVQLMDIYKPSWHAINQKGIEANYSLVSFEVCHSTGDEKVFRKAEEMTFRRMALVLKQLGLPADRSTVFYHGQITYTACPHRSIDLHGNGTVLLDYVIGRINYYLKGGALVDGGGGTVKPPVTPTKPTKPSKPSTGSIVVGSKVQVTNPVDYNGTSLSTSGTYDVMEVSGNRVVIGRGGQVTAAVHKNNLKLVSGGGTSTPAPKPAPSGGTIVKGSKVQVVNPRDYNGTSLSVSGTYDVIEVSGDRIVIGRGGQVTAAMRRSDLKLVSGGGTSTPAPKPAPKPSIKVGSNVVVTNPVDYNGTPLGVSGTYTVMELNGNRAVIGRGGQVTAAINTANLRLA